MLNSFLSFTTWNLDLSMWKKHPLINLIFYIIVSRHRNIQLTFVYSSSFWTQCLSEPYAFVGISLSQKSPSCLFLSVRRWLLKRHLGRRDWNNWGPPAKFPSLSLPFRRGRDGSIIKWFRKRHSLFHQAHFPQTSWFQCLPSPYLRFWMCMTVL